MKSKPTVLKEAQFSPKIKGFVLLLGALLMAVSIVGIVLLPFWLLGLGQYLGKRYYESLSCRLTTRHLEFKKGVFFKVEKTIPLENIQDLTFINNPILQIFDLQMLKIETAGSSNVNGSDMKLLGIINLSDFKTEVLDQRDVLTERYESGMSENASSDSAVLLEIRDLLQKILDQRAV
jgi:putative membrane protein